MTAQSERERPGDSLQLSVSNAIVGFLPEYTGRGPTKARTTIRDNVVFGDARSDADQRRAVPSRQRARRKGTRAASRVPGCDARGNQRQLPAHRTKVIGMMTQIPSPPTSPPRCPCPGPTAGHHPPSPQTPRAPASDGTAALTLASLRRDPTARPRQQERTGPPDGRSPGQCRSTAAAWLRRFVYTHQRSRRSDPPVPSKGARRGAPYAA